MSGQSKRAVLIEAVIASGLVAIAIPTGQVPLLTLATVATSVGCNWTHSLAERGFQSWCSRWFTDDGALNHDILKALRLAFAQAVRQVEHDWKHHAHYQYLQRKSPQEAQLTLDALRLLREQAYGPDHPDVAQVLHCLAQLYAQQNLYERAEPFFQRAFDIRLRKLGKNHPETITTMENYATPLRKAGRETEAEEIRKRVQDMQARQ